MASSCANRTLFNSLVAGKVDDPSDPCSTQLKVATSTNPWGIVTRDMLGLDASNIRIATFGVTKLPDEVLWLDIHHNQLTKLPEFVAKNLKQLYFMENSIKSLADMYIPSSVIELGMNSNLLRSVVNVTLPPNLQRLGFDDNQITSIKGVRYPDSLEQLYLKGNPVQEFEISASDVQTFRRVTLFDANITQTTCRNPKAELMDIKSVKLCVLPDDDWNALYHSSSRLNPEGEGMDSSSPTAAPTKSGSGSKGSSSSSTMFIAIGATVAVILIACLAFCLCRRKKKSSNNQCTKVTENNNNGPCATTTHRPTLEDDESEFREMASPRQTQRTRRTQRSKDDGWDDPLFKNWTIPLQNIREEQLIGKGAFGEVFKGTCNERAVAIKRLKKDFRKNDKYVQNFINEVRLLASLEHPNIVEFIGIAGDNLTNLLVVFEFMDRGDLRSVLSEYKAMGLSTGFDRERLRIAFDIANALTYLHSLEPKVLHRDLKSHNVLLNEQMEAKLTDFGISRQQSENMTVGMGTMRWMAPEVMMSQQYDEKADIFSFGVMLSELDTMDLPYAKVVDNRGRRLAEPALLERISRGAITVEFTETRMVDLVQLALECVALDPESRPSAAVITYRLQRMLKEHSEHLLQAENGMVISKSPAYASNFFVC